MSILCIGQAVYDLTFPLDSFIQENQKYRIQQRLSCMGGPAANASYLCALWGIETSLIARVGNDLFGKEIIQELSSVGVSTTSIYMDKLHSTSISCILSNKQNGSRTIINTPLPNEQFPITWPTQTPNVLLLDGHEKEASLEALQKYPQATSILDAGTYKPEIMELINRVDYLVCSQDFAYQYSGISISIDQEETWYKTFERLESINPNHIVITLGEHGALYKEHNKIYRIPAYPADTIDTTGAGDIFHGAFAYGLHSDLSLKEIIELSTLAAGISVETLGGQPSIPKLDKVKSKL